MKLLNDIIDGAISTDVSLPVILRKTLVLASQLKNETLKTWVLGELNGYDTLEGIPEYRKIRVQALGFFVGAFGSSINSQPLSPHVMKQEHKHWARETNLAGGVSTYETLLSGDDDSLAIAWPADLVVYYQSKFFEDFTLNRAWQPISRSSIAAILDTVRTRLLQFALELQEEIGDTEDPIHAVSPERVEAAVVNNIYGGQVTIGNVAGNVKQIGQNVVVHGDWNSLSSALQNAGVPASALSELESAIEADKAAGAPKGFGTKVAGWVAERGQALGDSVAGATVGAMVMSYLGLG